METLFKKILWATDFSPHAHHAGQRALECARCSGGTLYALTVVDPEDLPIVPGEIPDPFIKADQTEQITQRLESEYERRVMDHLKSEVEPLIRVGTPWREIVCAADELGATLLVIGSHGKRSLEELILGSTVENATKHAPCPVLVVR